MAPKSKVKKQEVPEEEVQEDVSMAEAPPTSGQEAASGGGDDDQSMRDDAAVEDQNDAEEEDDEDDDDEEEEDDVQKVRLVCFTLLFFFIYTISCFIFLFPGFESLDHSRNDEKLPATWPMFILSNPRPFF